MHNRKANVEFMRILCMLMIIYHHTFTWFLDEVGSVFSIMVNVIDVINRLTNFHVDVFILITGYFGIHNRRKALIKTLKTVMWYLLFTNIASYFIIGKFSWWQLLNPIQLQPWWFMCYYMWLILLAPYLNTICESMHTSREWLILLGTILLFDCYFYWWLNPSMNFYGHNFFTFLTCYFCGRYLNKHDLFLYKSIINKVRGGSLMIFIISILFVIIISILNHTLGFELRIPDYNSPFTLLLTITFFLVIKDWNIKPHRWIFFLSESVIGVYLLHSNEVFIPFIQKVFHCILHKYYSPFLAVVYPLVVVMVIYFFATIVDKLRILTFLIVDKAKNNTR